MNRKSPSPPEPGASPSPPAPATPATPATSATSAASAAGGPSFEVAIKRLGEIVQTLEKGDMPLEESLRLFEEGVKLSRVSQQRLDAAEKRVEQLLAVDAEGRAKTQPFATDAAETDDEREPDEGVPF